MEENSVLSTPIYQRIYAMVRQIPSGKVASYGQIARGMGGCTPRMVGYSLTALRSIRDTVEVPCHRVINNQGKISPHGDGFGSAVQRQLLEEEEVEFSASGVINFDRFGWLPL